MSDKGPPRNKLGITDWAGFKEADADLSGEAQALILVGSLKLPSKQGAERYRAIHEHLFSGHLYDGGQLRTQPSSKLLYEGYAARTHFTAPAKIASELDSVMQDVRQADGLRGLSRIEFSHAAADLFGRLNDVHPFTEGNGRTQQTYMMLLGRDAGHPFDFSAVTQERMYFVSAEFSHGRPEPMRELFDELTDPVRQHQLAKAHRLVETLSQRPALGIGLDTSMVSTCVPGRQYQGLALAADAETCVFYTPPKPHFFVANRADVAGAVAPHSPIPPFIATRSPLQEAHHALDLAERAAPKGQRAAALAQVAKAPFAHSAEMQAAGPARIKAAKVRDIGLVLQR